MVKLKGRSTRAGKSLRMYCRLEKPERRPKRSSNPRVDELFTRADRQESNGKLRSAFRLFLAAAKAGEPGCQINLGNYYDAGKGVRRNRAAALYWYKRAYRRGSWAAASNIGVMWRNENKPKLALEWFRKSVRLGDDEANLEIAKYYLLNKINPARAIYHLKKVRPSPYTTPAGVDEAGRLLKQAKKLSKRR
jgi:TPR repeat protein